MVVEAFDLATFMPTGSLVIPNVLLASVLAWAAWILQRWLRRPAIAHILWVLVLVKLVTPPLLSVPLSESPEPATCAAATCASEQAYEATRQYASSRCEHLLMPVVGWWIG